MVRTLGIPGGHFEARRNVAQATTSDHLQFGIVQPQVAGQRDFLGPQVACLGAVGPADHTPARCCRVVAAEVLAVPVQVVLAP